MLTGWSRREADLLVHLRAQGLAFLDRVGSRFDQRLRRDAEYGHRLPQRFDRAMRFDDRVPRRFTVLFGGSKLFENGLDAVQASGAVRLSYLFARLFLPAGLPRLSPACLGSIAAGSTHSCSQLTYPDSTNAFLKLSPGL